MRDKEKHNYINKRFNSAKKVKNYKHLCTQWQTIKPTQLKGEIDSFTKVAGDFNTTLSVPRQNSQTEDELEDRRPNTICQPDPTGTGRILYLAKTVGILSSSGHGTFSRIDPELGHKLSLSRFKQIDITQSIFFD